MGMLTMKRFTATVAAMAVFGAALTGCSGTMARTTPVDRVPNVVGEELKTAGSVLTRSHLDCNSWPGGSGRPFGTVISESPAAGTVAVIGLTITLYYSVGSGLISVPVTGGCP
jgi:beta-lactam-binding protein with PASTA domain